MLKLKLGGFPELFTVVWLEIISASDAMSRCSKEMALWTIRGSLKAPAHRGPTVLEFGHSWRRKIPAPEGTLGGRGSAADGLGEPGQPVRGGQAVGKDRSGQEQPTSPLTPVPPAPALAETLSDVR